MGISYQSALHNISFSNPQVDGRFLDFLKAHLQFLLVASLILWLNAVNLCPNAVSHILAKCVI